MGDIMTMARSQSKIHANDAKPERKQIKPTTS